MLRLSKRYIAILISIVILSNAIYCIKKLDGRNKEYVYAVGSELNELSEIISDNNIIIQQIKGDGNSLRRLEIFFSTYNRENTGTLSVLVTDEKTAIFADSIPTAEIEDNSFLTIEGNGERLVSDRDYYLVLSADNRDDSGVSVWSDADENLVCSYVTAEEGITAEGLIKLNLTFALAGYVICRILQALRRK